jgi:hypothetical protein
VGVDDPFPDPGWKRIGQLDTDEDGVLKFPSVPSAPGIYRFTISNGPETVAVYIGQAARSLRTRFALYRSRGKKPSLPLTRKTTSRIATRLLSALADGHSVSVDLFDVHDLELASKPSRDQLEQRLIRAAAAAGVPLLNRRR